VITSLKADRRTTLTWLVLTAISAVALVTFSFAVPYFLSVDNLINLLNEVALAGIVTMPATFLIMSGQVDLSVGATAAFVGIVLAATAPGSGLAPAVLIAVGSGLLIGLVNGLLVTIGGVASVAATFASMALLRGLAYLVPSGLAITVAGFRTLGNTRPVLGIALPTLILGGAVLIAAALSRSPRWDAGVARSACSLLPAAWTVAGSAAG
jgi:ribose transport system permease protein